MDAVLDVSRLPFTQVYRCHDGSEIIMRDFLESYKPVVELMGDKSLIKQNESFGFAMTDPGIKPGDLNHWDNPYEFVWFAGGWGPKRDQYVANAVRKLRAALRSGRDTLNLRVYHPFSFSERVESTVDGQFPWGDFPWGGAVWVEMARLTTVCAVSCLTEVEDHNMAQYLGGDVCKKIIVGDKLLVG